MKVKKEIKLAFTAIVAVIILIWGINYLKGISFFEKRNVYCAIYDRVDGLKVSSGVVYRGYQVGQVTSISFIGERYDKVLVRFSVKDNLNLPVNSSAMIQSDDLMGTKVINLIPGSSDVLAVTGDTLRSQIEQGLMEQVSNQILPLKQKAEHLLSSLDSVLTIVQGLFNDDTKQNLANSFQSIDQTLSHLEVASENLDTLIQNEAGRLGQILENVNSITFNLRNSNEQVTSILTNVSDITDSLRQANLKQTLYTFESSLKDINAILAKVERGEGTLGALLNDNDLYYNLNMSSENLNRLLVEFKYNPKRFIRLSLIDFSSAKALEEYGIVIAESEKPFANDHELYKKHPDLKEIKYKDKYLYLLDTYNRLKSAQRHLENVVKRYENAYIVKIDFI